MRGLKAGLPKHRLGRTDLLVPNLCFGTMLFGESTPPALAGVLLGSCMEHGCNFFDTAEMYPVPQSALTTGRSEEILGQWMQGERSVREDVIVATKAAGPSATMEWIRGGPSSLDASNITQAIDSSLRRLQTDYIDLYQIHWPDRYVPMFGDVDFDPSCSYTSVPLEEQLRALGDAVAAGKIRHVGLSNETAWGLMRCCALANTPGLNLPRVACLQNAYSLMCRTFDSSLAEVCHEEGVSLLAYSPLAMGLLTGKYLASDGGPPGARLNKYKGRYAEAESRYGSRPPVRTAVKAYCRLAAGAGMSPTELAIRFVVSHPLVASTVVGATSVAQLEELFSAALQPPIGQELRCAIDEVHASFPNPTP
ncbi:MAG: hypothetical protein WDW38_001464 [Sanguina aurantia]